MWQNFALKVAFLIGFFLVVPFVLVHTPWPGVYPQDQLKVQLILTAAGMSGLAFATLMFVLTRRPTTMADRKRARAALRAEWLANHRRVPEMAPLTPEDLRRAPDFNLEPPDWELPPRPPAASWAKLDFASLWRNFQPREDREAYEREVRRWD